MAEAELRGEETMKINIQRIESRDVAGVHGGLLITQVALQSFDAFGRHARGRLRGDLRLQRAPHP